MAHEVESMFYMGETPWHGLGQKLERAPTSAEAIKAAGLDWRVQLRKLFAEDTKADVPAKAVVRESDGTVLGVVGKTYNPLQNLQAFEFFDPVITAGLAEYHTAGSLRSGARVWILARLTRDPLVIAAADVVMPFILLSNAHDGTMAVRVGATSIRVVCANTLAVAHSAGESRLIRVRHGANVAADLAALREIMNEVSGAFEATAEQYRALQRRDISAKDLASYVRLVFNRGAKVGDFEGPAQEETPVEDESSAKIILPKIIKLFETGRGNDRPGVRGTLWAAYNAITEYLNYGRGKAADARLNSLWFGEGASINKRALSTALRMAADLADAEDDREEVPPAPPAPGPDAIDPETTAEEGDEIEQRPPRGARCRRPGARWAIAKWH